MTFSLSNPVSFEVSINFSKHRQSSQLDFVIKNRNTAKMAKSSSTTINSNLVVGLFIVLFVIGICCSIASAVALFFILRKKKDNSTAPTVPPQTPGTPQIIVVQDQ